MLVSAMARLSVWKAAHMLGTGYTANVSSKNAPATTEVVAMTNEAAPLAGVCPSVLGLVRPARKA